jgi:hypothetical protein
MVLYDALVKWILNRSLWSLLGASMLFVVGRWLQGLDALQLLRDFTVYFRSSLESVNVFSFIEHIYRAFSSCTLIWDGGLRNVCDGGANFINRGMEIVTLPFGSLDVFALEGGGAARFIKLPLLALAFVVGSVQSLGLAVITFFTDSSLLGIGLLLGSITLGLFIMGSGSPTTELKNVTGEIFDADGLWDLFGNFVGLLFWFFILLIVAALIALGLQLLLELVIAVFERTLGGVTVFGAYCYGGYKFLKSADDLNEIAKGNLASSKKKSK